MTATSTFRARTLLALGLVSASGVLARESVVGPAPRLPAPAAPEAEAACRLQDDHGASASPDACLICHEDLREIVEAEVQHMPVSDGECTMCHNAHAARYPKLLSERGRALCYKCHSEAILEYQTGSVHTPVRQGQCEDCHAVHGSQHEALLSSVGNDLCLSCHEEKHAAMQSRSVHEPFVEGDCSDCHLPHNSPYAGQLLAPADTLCTVCHDAADGALVEAHQDIPIEGSRCSACHDAHASSHRGLLKATVHEPVADLSCDLCHMVDSDTPQVVMATGARLCAVCHDGYPRPGDPHVHKPVADGQCTACHETHASDHAGLLPAAGPEFCLSCHEEITARRERARTTHPVDDEVSCRSCHLPHSSEEAHLMPAGPIRTCLNCHENQRHGHPLGNDRLDPRTGEPITCVTCHDPHGTDFPMQLRGDQTRGLCVECHTGDPDGHKRGSGR